MLALRRICPVRTGMNPTDKVAQMGFGNLPRVHGDEFAVPQSSKICISSGLILTKKCYPQKYDYLKWYILVLLRKSKTKKRLANHRNPLEKFSICPVYTGMSLTVFGQKPRDPDLPRIHGDEPCLLYSSGICKGYAPYTRG